MPRLKKKIWILILFLVFQSGELARAITGDICRDILAKVSSEVGSSAGNFSLWLHGQRPTLHTSKSVVGVVDALLVARNKGVHVALKRAQRFALSVSRGGVFS